MIFRQPRVGSGHAGSGACADLVREWQPDPLPEWATVVPCPHPPAGTTGITGGGFVIEEGAMHALGKPGSGVSATGALVRD